MCSIYLPFWSTFFTNFLEDLLRNNADVIQKYYISQTCAISCTARSKRVDRYCSRIQPCRNSVITLLFTVALTLLMVIVLLRNSTCYYWDSHPLVMWVKNTATYFALFLILKTNSQEQTIFDKFVQKIFSFNYEKTDTLPPNNYSFDSMLTLLGQKWNSLVGFSLV